MPDPNARATTKVSWQQSKEHGDITTVAISISGTDPKEAQQFYTYVRHELEEMEAGLDNELRDALTTPEKPPVLGVVLFGPDEEDLALFSFGRGGAQ